MKRTEGEIKREHGQAYVISLNTESDVFILARCGEDIHSPETFANADHIAVTWNASKGMTTKQAGLYLEHGEQALEILHKHCHLCGLGFDNIDEPRPCSANGGGSCGTKDIMTLMEGK